MCVVIFQHIHVDYEFFILYSADSPITQHIPTEKTLHRVSKCKSNKTFNSNK